MQTSLLLRLAVIVLTLSGHVFAQDDGGATLTLNGSGGTSGISISSTGTGTLVLSGANTINGSTTVSSGVLSVANSGSSTGAGTSGVIVLSGGTLAGAGTISDGSVLADGLGLLTLSDADSIIVGSPLLTGTISGVIIASPLTLNLGSTATATSSNLVKTAILLPATQGVKSSYLSTTQQLHLASGDLVQIPGTPEPSTWALLIGSIVALAVFRRLRLAKR